VSAISPVPFSSSSGQQATAATVITVTLPSYTTGDFILLMIARNTADASAFTYSAAVTSATELPAGGAGPRMLTAVQIVPDGTGQTTFTVTGTSSLWTWWIANYRGASVVLPVDSDTDAIGNSTSAVIVIPEAELGFIASGNEVAIAAGAVNSTATWTTDANTQFSTTANNAAMMVDAVNLTAGVLTAVYPFSGMNRGNSGSNRNQNSLALVLQQDPGGTVNLLSNPSFESGSTLATGWTDEHTTAIEASYTLVGTGVVDGTLAQNVAYTGQAGDSNAKTELYQAPVDIAPGDYLTFSVWLSGSVTNTYVDVGIEGFTSGAVFISEADTYAPTLTGTPVQYTVSYLCPGNASYVACYLSMPEIGPTSSLSVTADAATLISGSAPASVTGGSMSSSVAALVAAGIL
jgi:hypothetical protein